jgi:hypothetical protein
MTNSVSGSGATTYTANRASTYLTVGSAIGTAIRQSKSRAVYQPGKSMLVFQTFVLAPAQTNLRQRVGLFDAKNGIFLQLDDSELSMNIRSFVTGSAVDLKAARSAWNMDKLDGTGSSGKTLDITKPQILIVDLEWLGVGRVRTGFVLDGCPYYVHEFLNANSTHTSVYMSNPNLPLRWEIEANGTVTGTPQLEAICGSANSEGGYEITGITASADMGTTVNAIAAGATEEILAIRTKSGFTEFSTAFIQQTSALAATSSNFLWRLVLNPTETGAGTWADVNANGSVMEKNVSRVVTPDTGLVIAAGYVSANQNSVTALDRPVLTFGTTLAGVADVFSLQVTNLSVSSESYLGGLTWREIF